MQMVIPRGIIYHTLRQDFLSLATSLFAKLGRQKIVNQFEKQFASYNGCNHCVAFSHARTAIYYALKLNKFPKGSEIIMPPITIKAILDVVLALEMKPVFVDLNLDTLCFDIAQLKKSISVNTKAILITYLYGIVPDLEPMLSLCEESKLFVIEDFSQCLNGEYKGKKVGGFGDVGIYSASSIKTLDTYGGGLLITNNVGIYNQLLQYQSELSKPKRIFLIQKIIIDLVRNLATQRLVFHWIIFPLLNFINFFKPNTLIKHAGNRRQNRIQNLPATWFSAYTAPQARLGIRLLPKIKTHDEVRCKNAFHIRASTNLHFPQGVSNTKNVFWQTVAYFSNPLETLGALRHNKIDSATTSLVKISRLPEYPFKENTPNADLVYSNALFIPSYPGLKKRDLNRIVDTFIMIMKDNHE